MNKLKLKNNFDLCYPILESDPSSIRKKIEATISKRVKFYELRIDYLLDNRVSIDDIIYYMNDLNRDFSDKEFIVTIRTKNEGGAIDLSLYKYFSYIEKLMGKLKVSYIDIEYKYYSLALDAFNALIKKTNLKIILSKHIFDHEFSKENCEDIIKQLIKTKCNIVKLAVMIDKKNDLFSFMNIAKEHSIKLKDINKDAIFIAMGEMGRLSRIYPEYTNTKIVFVNAYENNSILGQYSLNSYIECRKLLAKLG